MWPPALSRVELVGSLLEPAGSTVVVVPDPVECDELAAAARAEGREVHVLRGDLPAADRTRAWADARHGACVVVGGRIAAFAPVPDLAGIVVLDDADESLAEERAPAWHARELAAERCRAADARLTFVSPAPTVEAVSLADGPPRQRVHRGRTPRLAARRGRRPARGAARAPGCCPGRSVRRSNARSPTAAARSSS